MKLYIVLWDDHHCDTEVTPFTNFDEAVEWVRSEIMQMGAPSEEIEEDMESELYFARYTCEGDYIRITEHNINL